MYFNRETVETKGNICKGLLNCCNVGKLKRWKVRRGCKKAFLQKSDLTTIQHFKFKIV